MGLAPDAPEPAAKFSANARAISDQAAKIEAVVVEVREETENRNPRLGSVGGKAQTRMVGEQGLEPWTR